MKTQRRSRFTHPLQALSAEFSIIVCFAAVIAQGKNTKTRGILVNMEIIVILGHEKTKIQNLID